MEKSKETNMTGMSLMEMIEASAVDEHTCPTCKVSPGQACKTKRGKPCKTHKRRLTKATAAGLR